MAPMYRRLLSIVLILLLALVSGDVPMAKHDVLVEIFYSGAWHDVTSRTRAAADIVINHAALNEATGLAPSDASLRFHNNDGVMNPENRRSSLYGLIGEGTLIRITVDDTRFAGRIFSWKPRRAKGPIDVLNGRGNAWVDIKAGGWIRQLGQGTPPVLSAMTRALISNPSYLGWWPLESGLLAQSPGTNPGVIADSPVGPAVQSPLTKITDGVLGTDGLVDLSNGTRIDFPVPDHTLIPLTGYIVEVMIRWQPAGFTGALSVDAVRLVFGTGSGTSTDRVNVETNTSGQAFLFMLDTGAGSGTATMEENVYDGATRHIRIEVYQDGANTVGIVTMNGAATASGSTSLTSTTLTKLKTVSVNFVGESGTKIPAVGQVIVYNTLPFGPGVDAFDGYLAESAEDRFNRLCSELGITGTVVGSGGTQLMGPQYPDTTLGIFGEIARTDAGIIHDTRSQLGLTFRTGRSLYNQTPTTLDFDVGEIADPLEPDIDDFGRINTVIAKRRNSDQVIDSDTDGPLGTAAIGEYQTQVNVNPELVSELPQHARYHLIINTDPAPRYPTVIADFDAAPARAAEFAAVDVGGILGLQSIPEDLGEPTADVLVPGYTEVIGSHRRTIAFNGLRGGILTHVGQLDANGGLQTSGAQLGGAVGSEQTSFNVTTTTGPVFTSSPPAGAQIIVRDREVMTVTGINALNDTFTRTVAAGSWGTSTSGHTYTLSDASIGSVNGTQGVLALSTVNVEKHATASLGVHGLVDLSTWLTLGVTPTGAPINWGLLLRYTDVNNYYWADAQIATTGVITLRLIKRVAGVATQITTTTAPVAHSTTVPRVLRAMYDPSTGTFASRIWSSDASDPLAWQLSTTDTAVPAGTRAGVIARLMTGNTNTTPVSFLYDNLTVYTPQLFTVTRDPDLRMDHPDEADVLVYRPLRLTL